MTTPPIAARLAVFGYALYAGSMLQQRGLPLEEWTPPRPVCVTVLGLAHALAVHLPAVWSQRVHRLRAAMLLERFVYYFLMQAMALSLGEASLPAAARVLMMYVMADAPYAEQALLDDGALWTMAAYLGVYYAWDVHAVGEASATLSPQALSVSMALFAGATMPVVLGSVMPRIEGPLLGPDDGWRISDAAWLRNHLAAAVSAEVICGQFELMAKHVLQPSYPPAY